MKNVFLLPVYLLAALARMLRPAGARVIVAAVVLVASQAQAADLRSQVRDLAAAHNFDIVGLDRIQDADEKQVEGDVNEQLKALLSEFNYVVLHGASGAVEKVIISSRKDPTAGAPRQYVVNTTRRGGHHIVQALLAGPTGIEQKALLIVDTGATSVVLPESMSRTLGFRANELQDGIGQTANGKVTSKLGTLSSVRIGQVVVRDVTVAFVKDGMLGGQLLLGMSFLGHFRLTIDDASSRLLLVGED